MESKRDEKQPAFHFPLSPFLPDPTAVRIHLLGEFRVEVGGRAIPADAWKRRKARSLVKLLALSRDNHSLHRDELLDQLWPDLDPDAAANNLRHTLHLARRALRTGADDPPLADIVPLDDRLALRAIGSARLWIDSEAFEEAATTAQGVDDPRRIQAALDLYTGDLLPEDRYEDWTTARREQLHARHIALLLDLARLHEGAQAYPEAIAALQRIITIDPAHEDAAVALMALHARVGRRTEALREYQRLRGALQRELDAEPSPATQQIYAEILSGGGHGVAETPAPAPPLAEQPHNIPAPRTDLIGRADDIAQVSRALDGARLVSVIGAGGSGKTRLALAVARALLEKAAFPAGVWFVELGALTQPEAIPAAIARVLDIPLPADRNRDELAALTTALRTRRLLLLLDNCEHLIAAAAHVADQLLAACPGLSILATSREPLRLAGELVYRLSPLTVPEDGATFAEIQTSPAGQLFLARVRTHQPIFDLTPDNAADVASICRQLDGLPLAIELAAARIVVLDVAELAQRLDNALPLLSKGNRTAAPRQQTLRATLEWSYALLSPDEQAALGRLSVFQRGWTLPAAEAIVADVRIPHAAVLDLLAGLIDKSLVTIDATERGLRYRMLEPVRQFASEQLRLADDSHAVHTRHARYFLQLAETNEPKLRGPELAVASERLDAERDNLRSAFDWLRGTDPEAMLQLAAVLGRFWYVRGYVREGRELLGIALAEGPTDDSEIRLRAIQHVGILAEEAGAHAEAIQLLEQALALLEHRDDPFRSASVMNSLGAVELALGHLDRAQTLFESSLAIRRTLGDPLLLPPVLGNLALLAWRRGDLDRSETLFDEVIVIAQATGDEWSLALCATDKGRIAWQRGEYTRSHALFRDSLSRATALHDLGAMADALEGLAGALAALGQTTRAARIWGASETLREAHDVVIPAAERGLYDQMVTRSRTQVDADTFAVAWESGWELSLQQVLELAHAVVDVSAPAPMSGLTQREQEIASLVARGLTNRQIAATLGMAPRTADTHVSNILRKLGLTSRTDLQTTSTHDCPTVL